MTNLNGFQSTTRVLDTAIGFAFRGLRPNLLPVIMEIDYKCGGAGHFRLDTADYSDYPAEQEIVLADGLPATVIKVACNVDAGVAN